MRVLYLNPFSQEVSGPDESLLTMLGRLIPLGIEAHVAIPTAGPQVERYQKLGAAVHVLPLTVLRRQASLGELRRLTASALGSLPALTRLCRRIRPDVIHTNMEVVIDGLLVGRLLGIPHVLHYRGNTLDEPRVVFDVLVRFWTSLSRRVFCISSATAALFESRGRGGRAEVMYNPVDLQSFAAARRDDGLRAEWAAGPHAFLVGTVARLHPRKDLETFLRACAAVAPRVPSARFVVVGTAAGQEEVAYADRLRGLAGDLGIADRVVWAGSRRDIPVVMNSLDLFVLTSRHEGFGRVVAEAMAAGCPVVVSDEGAPPELIEGGRSGLQAHAGDAASFAAQIERLAEDPATRARLAVAGRLRSQAFDADTVAVRMRAAYQSLCHP